MLDHALKFEKAFKVLEEEELDYVSSYGRTTLLQRGSQIRVGESQINKSLTP